MKPKFGKKITQYLFFCCSRKIQFISKPHRHSPIPRTLVRSKRSLADADVTRFLIGLYPERGVDGGISLVERIHELPYWWISSIDNHESHSNRR